MLKRNVTYEDFNGETVTETFYFHLSKPELIELDVDQKGGLSALLARIIETNDAQGIIREFKKLILLSYGQKSDDGKRFIKNDQLREEFTQTAAYPVLFMEIASDENAAMEFIKGIMPADMAEDIEKAEAAEKIPDKPTAPPRPPTAA